MSGDERVAALHRDLVSLHPVDERERRSVAQFLSALDRLERPFDQHADDTHVTASAVVRSSAGVLLHRHKRLGVWMQPGGHVDDDETPAAAARREVLEETGLDTHHVTEPPRVVHVDVHAGGRGHTHLDVRYLLRAPAEPPRPPPEESQDVAWFDMSEAIAVADPGLRGLLVHLSDIGLRAM